MMICPVQIPPRRKEVHQPFVLSGKPSRRNSDPHKNKRNNIHTKTNRRQSSDIFKKILHIIVEQRE